MEHSRKRVTETNAIPDNYGKNVGDSSRKPMENQRSSLALPKRLP